MISGFEYTYDDLSRIAEEKIFAGAVKVCYTYDALSRVTGRTVRRCVFRELYLRRGGQRHRRFRRYGDKIRLRTRIDRGRDRQRLQNLPFRLQREHGRRNERKRNGHRYLCVRYLRQAAFPYRNERDPVRVQRQGRRYNRYERADLYAGEVLLPGYEAVYQRGYFLALLFLYNGLLFRYYCIAVLNTKSSRHFYSGGSAWGVFL